MKKIYISGKITGDPNYREKFLKEEDRLFSLGYEPVNPAACVPSGTEWAKAMKTVLRVMLLCDGVSLLPDWRKSRGAKIEARLARKLGMDVRPYATSNCCAFSSAVAASLAFGDLERAKSFLIFALIFSMSFSMKNLKRKAPGPGTQASGCRYGSTGKTSKILQGGHGLLLKVTLWCGKR